MEEAVEREWLTYKQASAFSGLGRTKLWTLVSSGEVQAARIGRAVRLSRRSLQDYMTRHSYTHTD